MKTTLALASFAFLGANAISVNPTGTEQIATPEPPKETPPAAAPAKDNAKDMMLTTYIGFEFEGAKLAEMFSALTNK